MCQDIQLSLNINKALSCGLTLLILLSSCASQKATTEITSAAWRDDLRYLARELPGRHINAFHTVGREALAGEVARLEAVRGARNSCFSSRD